MLVNAYHVHMRTCLCKCVCCVCVCVAPSKLERCLLLFPLTNGSSKVLHKHTRLFNFTRVHLRADHGAKRYLRMHMCVLAVCVSLYESMSMSMCVCVCVCVCVCACENVCARVYVCACVYVESLWAHGYFW